MKIIDLKATQLRLKTVENIFDGTQDVLIVKVTTDEGLVGYGEVVSSSYVAKAVIEAPKSGGGRHGLREIVMGMDASDPAAIWDAMYRETEWYGRRGVAIHAMAGIDIALWDLVGRAAGLPVYQILTPNPPRAPEMKAYASLLWGDTLPETFQLVREVLAHGFRAVKFGFGDPRATLEDDLARIRTAQEALDGRGDLMMDIGRRWNVDEAIRRSEAIQSMDQPPLWLEEPLPPDDLDGYALLCSSVDIPIASAETEETVEQFQAFIDAGVRVIQPDLGRVGITQAMRIEEMARDAGVMCVPHCFGTGINTTAAIHWMAATGNSLTEYPMRTNALCRNLAAGLPPLRDGMVAPSPEPGLGLEMNPAVIAEYAYTG